MYVNDERKRAYIFHTSIMGIMQPNITWYASGRYGYNFNNVISKNALPTKLMSIYCVIFLSRMPQDVFGDNTILIQLMAMCHYLSPFWPNHMWQYDVTWPPWVNLATIETWLTVIIIQKYTTKPTEMGIIGSSVSRVCSTPRYLVVKCCNMHALVDGYIIIVM